MYKKFRGNFRGRNEEKKHVKTPCNSNFYNSCLGPSKEEINVPQGANRRSNKNKALTTVISYMIFRVTLIIKEM
jgi:hypothetical protein